MKTQNKSVNDLLMKVGINIDDTNCFLGNKLYLHLSSMGIKIDYEKDIALLTNKEKLEIGRILIFPIKGNNVYSSFEIIDWFQKDIIDKSIKI